MGSIREYAHKCGFAVVGKLTRRPEWEYTKQLDGTRKYNGAKSYSDEAGNEYEIGKKGVCIVTADGAVI